MELSKDENSIYNMCLFLFTRLSHNSTKLKLGKGAPKDRRVLWSAFNRASREHPEKLLLSQWASQTGIVSLVFTKNFFTMNRSFIKCFFWHVLR